MSRRTLIPLLVAGSLVAAAGPASAAVTIGSNLANPGPFTNMNCGVPCTTANLTLIPASQAPGGLTSPVNGTVVGFSVRSGSSGNVNVRVLRPGTGLSYTGVGTSALSPISTGVTGPIPTSLPIQIGDGIGLDNPADHLVIAGNPGATQVYWTSPPLADGTPRAGTAGGAHETMVQAVIEPSNTLTFGNATRNRKKGTATLPLGVPNAGQLTVSGTGVKVVGVTPTVNAPATLQLTVKATGKKRKKLNAKGKVTVTPQLTFTPNNGAARTQSIKVKLLKKL